MGMPINSFRVLNAIQDLDFQQVFPQSKLADALNRFSLFAFVLHEPNYHADVDETLQREFVKLDRLTGPHLLFFALLEVPRKLEKSLSQRSYFRALAKSLEVHTGISTDLRQASVRNPMATASAASQILGIGPSRLPGVVVFLPGAHRMLYLPTTSSRLVDQLSRLGRVSERIFRTGLLALEDVELRERGLREFCDEEGLATVPIEQPHHRRDRKDTVRQVANVYNNQARSREVVRLGRYISNEQSRRAAELLPEESSPLEEAVMDLAFHLGCNFAPPPRISYPNAPWGLWEFETAATLQTAFRLEAVPGMLDFSPLAICYAKALEVELNASLVQDLRRKHHIDMPEFFMRYQPGRSVTLHVEKLERNINLNKKDKAFNGALRPLKGLGSIHQAVKENQPLGGLDDDGWALLSRVIDTVKKPRNDAAHTRLVSFESVKKCRSAIDDLVRSGVIHRLFETKRDLRGEEVSSVERHPSEPPR